MQCVLHVDDEVATRQAVLQELAPFYDVVCAESRREGREILQRSPVQLVILESRLSDGCGLELLGEIRRGDPRLPVIMVTRFGSESVCVAAFRLGASDYFPKPVDLCELLRSVRLLIAASWSHHRHLVGTLSLPHDRLRSPLTPSTVLERGGQVQRAVQFIDEHYAEPLPLRRVASAAAMSKFAFSRAFTAVMGVQFRTYLLQLRIAKACPLLADSSRSISDVAQVVGFTDLPRFDKVFRRETGLSPREYRRHHQPEQQTTKNKQQTTSQGRSVSSLIGGHGASPFRRAAVNASSARGATVPAGRLLVALVLAYTVSPFHHDACAQQAAINYIYDDLNRLVAAVDQQGNVATYTYDLVGNLLKIDRVDAASLPDPVAITFVSPNRGAVAATVQIFGKGFSATAGQNAVAFNGTPATVTAAAPNRLLTAVPAGATSGPIAVTAPLGSAASPTAFRVVGPIAISPPGAVLLVNSTQQFSVLEIGNPGASFAWSVNGVSGGYATIGTVSPTGLYSAPASVPSPAGVTLIATETDDPTLSGGVTIRIWTAPGTTAAIPVSVTVAPPPTPPQAATPSAVPVSVMVSPASAPTPATSEAAPVAVTMEPVVTGVAPASAARGTANLALTLTGAGFAGATSLTFLQNNAADSTITIADLIVNEAGTQATATISIAAGAATGGRVVQISKPSGNSTVASTGANVLTVQ